MALLRGSPLLMDLNDAPKNVGFVLTHTTPCLGYLGPFLAVFFQRVCVWDGVQFCDIIFFHTVRKY